mgnify:CR=1 FL=1
MADLRTITSADYMLQRYSFNIEKEIKDNEGLSYQNLIDMAYEDIVAFVLQNNQNLIKKSDVEEALKGYTHEFSGRYFNWAKHGTLKEMANILTQKSVVLDDELTEERKNAFRDAQTSLIISYFAGIKEGVYNGNETSMPINKETYSILFNRLGLFNLPNTLIGGGF